MATKLQIRRDTAANWASANPVLSSGELGFETDTYKLKIGNGSSAWNSLAYYDDQISGLDSTAAIGLLSNGSVQHIIPAGNELYDLGDSNNRFRDLYLSGNTLNLGGATLSADSSGALTLPSTIKIGDTTLQATASGVTIGDSGGAILDSAAVLGFINAAYIQSNQITYNNNDFADSAFVTAQINNLIDGAPGTLDTLNEIAAALNDDDSAYATLLNLINAKSDLDSAAVTSLIDSSYIQLRRPAETIMTVTGDGANYYFTGDGFPSTSSGDPTLYLTRGKTYQFEGISGSHPFEIRQSAGGSAYSTGVTNNGGSGTVIFTVPMDAPASLVYQCTVHSGMVGDIVILDNSAGSGVDSAAVTALIDSAYIQARQTSGGGGTGGSLTAVASGALSDGTIVVVNSDGTVSAASQVVTASNASPVTFNSGDTRKISAAYDTNAQKVVVVYQDATASNNLKAVVGTVSGSTISFGSPVTFFASNGLEARCVYDTNAQKIVVAYHDASYNGYGIVGTVSGSTISFGSATAFDASGEAASYDMVYDENAQKVVITWRRYNSGNPGLAVVGTVSGTSISFGSAVQFTSNIGSTTSHISYNAAAQKVVITYPDANNTNKPYAIVGTVSGTSISFGSAVLLGNHNYSYNPKSVYDANAQKTVFFYYNSNGNNGVDAVVGTVSGSSISLGTPVTVQHNWYSLGFASFVYDTTAQKIVALYRNGYDRSGSGTGTSIMVGTVSGTSISFGIPTYIESGSGLEFDQMSSIVYDASAQKVVSVFDTSGSSGEGKAVVSQLGYTSANLTAENYIGISDGAYSDGDSATIQITGSVDDAQTGLTAGQTYYVQSDGTLATTPDTISVIAGTAVSSTKLLIRADQDTISSGLDSSSTIALIDSAYIQARQVDIYRDSAFITNLVDSAYIQLRDRFQDSSGITAIVDSAYVQARQSTASGGLDSAATISLINNNTNSGFYKYKYTATAGQTVFADSDANGNVMSFDPNSTLVFYNGVLLDETTDYEASSNTVTLTSGADAGVSITVAKYGVGYVAPTIAWGGDRGLVGGGSNNSTDVTNANKINYMDITTLGNASVFGTLTAGRNDNAAVGNGTYALFAGGRSGSNYEVNIIDYITVATTGNASDVGDLNRGAYEMGTGLSDGTYGVIAGGRLGPANYTIINDIQYLTISTSGNASDFGDMSVATRRPSQVSHSTRGIIAGGEQVSTGATTTIEYITIASPSNATDFGDLTGTNYGMAPMGDGTYGVLAGGERSGYIASIDYVTIDTPANATDFGDLSTAKWNAAGCNNATRGLVMGGENGSATIIQYLDITTPGNAASFGSLANEHTRGSGASGNPS